MPVGVEQWRAAVGAMARSSAPKPQSPIGPHWKKWLKASDPVAYKGCVVLLVVVGQLVWSGVEQCKEKMKEGSECVRQSASRGKTRVLAMRVRPSAVLVTSFLSQVLLCGKSSLALSKLTTSVKKRIKHFSVCGYLLLLYVCVSVSVLKRCLQLWASVVYRKCSKKTVAEGVVWMMSVLFSGSVRTGVRMVTMIVFVNQMLLMMAGDVERNPGPGKNQHNVILNNYSLQYIVHASLQAILVLLTSSV